MKTINPLKYLGKVFNNVESIRTFKRINERLEG